MHFISNFLQSPSKKKHEVLVNFRTPGNTAFRGSPRKTAVFSEVLSNDHCALWPVPPWTTLRPVDGGDNAARCPLAAHRPHTRCPPLHCTGGHAPRNPPPCIRTAHLVKNFPRSPETLRPSACALRLPLPAGWQAAGARGREATGGAAQGGRGAARPAAVEPP